MCMLIDGVRRQQAWANIEFKANLPLDIKNNLRII